MLNNLQETDLKNNLQKPILIAHSPDADDAFMFYALSNNLVKSDFLEFKHELKDIQTLNKEAVNLKYDVQAISFFAYPDVEDKYQLLSCGGSLGYGYGPLVITKNKLLENKLESLKNQTIAVPGEKTTAFLLLKLLVKDFKPVFVPFDKILESVTRGDYPYGLIIHEGQLSYLKYGLSKVVDLGEWWLGKTNLPVPLGGNVVKRTFSDIEKKETNLSIKRSIAYALSMKEKIVAGVSKYAREIEDDKNLVYKFVSMYVNDFTLDYGISGKLAIKKLYQMAFNEGLIKKIPILDFVEGDMSLRGA
ncbi:MAG: ABC transporter substrate-binding protein [Candidatus Melainabacteria bacterium]|nr:ABC transporter substrate-binding protein [Candidatus Melainabacteria bacterium]